MLMYEKEKIWKMMVGTRDILGDFLYLYISLARDGI